MTDIHLDFAPMPHLVQGQPPAWGAGAFPWTFVITQNDHARYAASANDTRSPLPARTNLGANFTTLEAAQEACRVWLRSKLQ